MNAFDFAKIPVLSDLPKRDLAWLAAHCTLESFDPGDVIFSEGDEVDGLRIILSGHIDLSKRKGGQQQVYVTILAGEITGRFPFSRMEGTKASARAAVPVQTAVLSQRYFGEMHEHAPLLLERLVHLMMDRAREYTRLSEQQEKLVSLGTMSAGLAHELNNPASAAHRAAQTLLETLQSFDEHAAKLLCDVIFRDEVKVEDGVDPFSPLYKAMMLTSPDLGALEQSEREDDLSDFLADYGVEKPWELAATLVAGGLTREVLEPFADKVEPEQIQNVLTWVPRDVEMRLLVGELLESTRRISELVGAMKAYSYMDQLHEKRPTDIKQGLYDTLTILKHKFKNKNLALVKNLAALPPVPAYGAELNQVWTNLLDNAVSAVPAAGGVITLTSSLDASGEYACIDIGDNGPGIPPEVQARIFEPFYTTKGVGEGTGLGLDIANRIVVNLHHGSIRVSSVPGETHFTVRLPLH